MCNTDGSFDLICFQRTLPSEPETKALIRPRNHQYRRAFYYVGSGSLVVDNVVFISLVAGTGNALSWEDIQARRRFKISFALRLFQGPASTVDGS